VKDIPIAMTKFYSGPTGNNVLDAFMCAISVYVAYTAIHGRVGPIEVFILSIFGVIGKI
jgi:hypothetical protein